MFHLMKDEIAAFAESWDRAAYVNYTRGNLKLETAATYAWILVTITESGDDRTLVCGIARSPGKHTRENKKRKNSRVLSHRGCSAMCQILREKNYLFIFFFFWNKIGLFYNKIDILAFKSSHTKLYVYHCLYFVPVSFCYFIFLFKNLYTR